MFVKICELGLKRSVVPRSGSRHRDQRRLRLAEPILLAMEFALARYFEFEKSESALTTETPTPCRPPETL